MRNFGDIIGTPLNTPPPHYPVQPREKCRNQWYALQL